MCGLKRSVATPDNGVHAHGRAIRRRDARARGTSAALGAAAERPRSHALGVWEPGAGDTCPSELHDGYSVVGPDGKLYPTWHPPRVVDPATGERCTFGHEHGRDPARSDLAGWIARKLAADGVPRRRAGIPFGLANEALDDYAGENPGTPTRHEDHVGHKVEWENDVELERASGGGQTEIGVRCDFLTKVHQGSHSADALGNNVHELLYAVRCDDGTRLLATKLVTFGAPNEFVRACDKTHGARCRHLAHLPGGRRGPVDPRPRLHREPRPRRRRAVLAVLAGPVRGLDLLELPAHRGRRAARLLRPALRRLQPKPLRLRRRSSRAASSTPAGRPSRTATRRAAGACDLATADGTIPSPIPFTSVCLAVRRRAPRGLLQPDHGLQRGRAAAVVDGSLRRQRVAGAVPRSHLPARLADRQHDRPTLESQAFGAARPYGGRGVHAPN